MDDCGRCHLRIKHEEDAWTISTIPYLLLAWQGHIYVDYVFSVNILFYVFMYLFKGFYKASFRLRTFGDSNDLYDWFNCRYISAPKAAWRVFGIDTTNKNPSAHTLPVHLKGQNRFQYAQGSKGQSTVSDLIRYIDLCPDHPQFSSLTYAKYFEQYVLRPIPAIGRLPPDASPRAPPSQPYGCKKVRQT